MTFVFIIPNHSNISPHHHGTCLFNKYFLMQNRNQTHPFILICFQISISRLNLVQVPSQCGKPYQLDTPTNTIYTCILQPWLVYQATRSVKDQKRPLEGMMELWNSVKSQDIKGLIQLAFHPFLAWQALRAPFCLSTKLIDKQA